MHDFVLRRRDDEVDRYAYLLCSAESVDGAKDLRTHVCGHLAMHEHEPERINEIRWTYGGDLAKCAGGAEVHIEAGDFVEDHGIRQRQAQDGRGRVFEIELGATERCLGDDIACLLYTSRCV